MSLGSVTSFSWIAYAALGLVAGFASGCFGIGGGAILVPIFILAFGLPYHVAVGTSLALILPIALAGSATNFTLQKIHWPVFWSCAIAGVVGAVGGALLIQKIPELYARRAFAIFLIYFSWRLWGKG